MNRGERRLVEASNFDGAVLGDVVLEQVQEPQSQSTVQAQPDEAKPEAKAEAKPKPKPKPKVVAKPKDESGPTAVQSVAVRAV